MKPPIIFSGISLVFVMCVFGFQSYAHAGSGTNTLVIVETDGLKGFNELTRDFRGAGFRIYHRVPPHIMMGYLPAGQMGTLVETGPQALLVTQEYVDVREYVVLGRATQLVLESWNTMLDMKRGIIHPDLSVGIMDFYDNVYGSLKPSPEEVEESLLYCGRSRKLLSDAEVPLGADFNDTSEYWIGDVALSVFFPESNGAIDPETENWTSSEESTVTTGIIQAYDELIVEEGHDFLSYTYEFNYAEPCSYEAKNSTDPNPAKKWVSEIMDNRGYTAYGTHLSKTRAYCNDLRDRLETHWAHIVFMVDTAGMMPIAWAYPGGPYGIAVDTMPYNVHHHETAHIFWAFDEYGSSDCACDEATGYLNYENQNCKAESCASSTACRMDNPYMVKKYCAYTTGQIGWADSDTDGLPDVVDTFPETTLNHHDPSPAGAVTYHGSATVVPLENVNPQSWCAGNDISVNSIALVEYRIDGGPWKPATADDGCFDEPVESFAFTTLPLTNGTYFIEVRATNNYGNLETDYAIDTLIISDVVPVDATYLLLTLVACITVLMLPFLYLF